MILLLAPLTATGHAQTPTRKVLVLYSSERPFGVQSAFAAALKPDLIRASPEPIDFVELTIQATKSHAPAPDAEFATHVHEAFEKQALDLVITVGGPAAMFAQQFRDQLFPTTPMLFAGVDRRFLENVKFTERETAVATEHDPALMMDSIMRLLPETRTVMVVIGASPLEKFWLQETQRAFSKFDGTVQFLWTNELSLAQIVERSKTMPPHSAIFLTILSIDGKGAPVVAEDALAAIHAAANAPVFGLYESSLGKGIVGGPLLTSGEQSEKAAKVAARILGGESPAAIRTPIQHASQSIFDARELARWNISESRLPQGSIIRFRQLPMWQRYRTVAIAGAILLGVNLIVAAFVLAGIAKRRRSVLAPSRAAQAAIPANTTVRMWTAGVDGRRIQPDTDDDWIGSIHPDDLGCCLEIYRRAFARREPFQMEYRVRGGDGAERWVLDTGMPKSSGDIFEGFVGTAVDVTGLGRARAELSNLSRHLMRENEDERAAVSKALHEDIGQRIGVLTMRLHRLKASQGDEMKAVVDEISEQLGALSGDIVTVSDPLYQKIEVLGLTAATRALCDELSAQYEIAIHFEHEHVPADLPIFVAVALFRVMQEAVVNAVKHSASLDVWVSLRGAASELRLEILDSGIGFDEQRDVRSDCVGLVGIRERLKLVNGGSAIESRPGEGTRVVAWVPLEATI